MKVWQALGSALVVALAAQSVGAPEADTLIVTKKVTKLRNARRLYARAVAELQEGDKCTQLSKKGAWYQVSFGDHKGWIHQSDVTDRPNVRLSGQGVRESFTAEETAAAGKGFNRDIEDEYKKTRPALRAAFQVVDAIQSRVVTEESVVSFLREGKLIEEDDQ